MEETNAPRSWQRSEDHLEEHLGTGALATDEGRADAHAQAECGYRPEPRTEDEPARGGDRPQEISGRVLRLVPKTAPLAAAGPDTSVVDFLRELIARIDRREVDPAGLVVHYIANTGHHSYWRWNMSALDHLGLLTMAQVDIIRQESE